MIDEIKKAIAEVEKFDATRLQEVEEFRIKYLGKKGVLNHYFSVFKSVPNEQKKEYGQVVNQLKNLAQAKVDTLKSVLEGTEEQRGESGDLTRPGDPIVVGGRHPISIV